jgi:hypothetical protein
VGRSAVRLLCSLNRQVPQWEAFARWRETTNRRSPPPQEAATFFVFRLGHGYGFEKRHIEFAKQADPPYDYVQSVKDWPCHDCAVIFGQFHVFGCHWEQCARCEGQRLGCGCALASDYNE